MPAESQRGVDSYQAFQSRSYFGALDGLRAVSILLVLLHHAVAWPAGSALEILHQNGRYGVSSFFIISGFLICTLLLREEQSTGRIDFRKFYARRALRLLPLYYVALMVQAVLVFVLDQYTEMNQQLFREKLPSYIFYYSNWLESATKGPFFCAWSLAVEEQFYFGFGLLFFVASRRFVVWVALAALISKPILHAWIGPVDLATPGRILFSYQEPILLGVLVAFALHERSGFEWFRRWLKSPWVLGAIGAATILWLALHRMQHASAWDAQLLYLLMTSVLVGLVLRRRTPVLDSSWLTHVGKVSYGIYLLHMFVICLLWKIPGNYPPWLVFGAATAATTLAASISFKYMEQPIIGFYKARFSPVAPARPVVSIPAAAA